MEYEPLNTYTAERIEKGSRFIGICTPCRTLEQFEGFYSDLKDHYQDASHIVYAYQIKSHQSLLTRFSDAGEPSGTAGKPVLNHLIGHSLINTALFVIRYFGGTKLGASGLIRAYGNSASDVLKECKVSEYIEYVDCTIEYSYAIKKTLDRLFSRHKILLQSTKYSDFLISEIKIPLKFVDIFKEEISSYGLNIKKD